MKPVYILNRMHGETVFADANPFQNDFFLLLIY